MTRTVVSGSSSRNLREEDCSIHNHLRSHVHLTNCIHLQNHTHKCSPMSTENALKKDLIVLQRSRSLRDPSTSSYWHSPLIDSSSMKLEKEGTVKSDRRSVGLDWRGDSGTDRSASPLITGIEAARILDWKNRNSPQIEKRYDGSEALIDQRSGNRVAKVSRNVTGQERSTSLEHPTTPLLDLALGKAVCEGIRVSQKGNYCQTCYHRNISEEAKGRSLGCEEIGSSQSGYRDRHIKDKRIIQKLKASTRGGSGREQYRLQTELSVVKQRKLTGTRIAQAAPGSECSEDHNELSVASNSLAKGVHAKNHPGLNVVEGHEEDDEPEITRAPRNGCGILWNSSRVHHGGKTFLDMAGHSFSSCALSDFRLGKVEDLGLQIHMSSRGGSSLGKLLSSDHSRSSRRSDSDVLALLMKPSGSQESSRNDVWTQDYSGELGIYGNQSLTQNQVSELASETRSYNGCDVRCYLQSNRLILGERHRSLTEKYSPRSFKDLVGQHLVAYALSNSVIQKKVGLLYVFYGPHGTGKTSCARIFARALNCQSSEYLRPCGSCNSCISDEIGKSSSTYEVDPFVDFENSMDHIEDVILSRNSALYRVFIVDDCDSLPFNSWSAISKVIGRAARHTVIVLISTNIDHLPHTIMSRCQKFFFPKLRDADIISTLHYISTQENIEIEKDALKLIASRSDGSLRNAEMILDQLSLLGQKISVALVQELIGLTSDDKLVDLDSALSAETVNTVNTLREIMEAGVEPLTLISQLATTITDILVGSYIFTGERLRKRLFQHPTLSREEMRKLRQAFKNLSEAEKELRTSNDKLTWLTSALLHLAPEHQHSVHSFSAETSYSCSPIRPGTRDHSRRENGGHYELLKNRRASLHVASTADAYDGGQISSMSHKDIEEIWENMLEKIHPDTLQQFLNHEAKLLSVNLDAAPTVQLAFNSQANKAKAEKFMVCISQALQSVLHFPVQLEILYERKEERGVVESPLAMVTENIISQTIAVHELKASNKISKGDVKNVRGPSNNINTKPVGSSQVQSLCSKPQEITRNEIVEVMASPNHHDTEHLQSDSQINENHLGRALVEETGCSHQSSSVLFPERQPKTRVHQLQSLVKGKVTLAHVIRQAGYTQQGGWCGGRNISVAEKLEQANLRLEPNSRILLSWKASKVALRKLPNLRSRRRRSGSLLRLVCCPTCPC